MASSDRTRRSSRSTRSKSQLRRKSENTACSEIVFVQNKLPTDFSQEKDESVVGASAKPDQPLRRKSSSVEQQKKSARSLRIGSKRCSIPDGIPNSSLLEHIATCRFFHHYVSPTRTFFRLDLDFTHAIVDGASRRAILAEAIIAMGVLTLPNKDRAAYTAARLRHTRALRLTNKALQNSVYAKSDEILLAVILLGLYETTPDATHSITSWTSHLDGARYLLQLREQTLQTGVAYRMFSILRVQILMNCFMSMRSVPQDLVDLSMSLLDSQVDEERAASQLMTLFARMCNLVASAKDTTTQDISLTIMEATMLDMDLDIWAANAPGDLEIVKEPATPAARAYADTYEVYSSIWSAEVWMIYRTARFGVSSLLTSLYSAILVHAQERGSLSPSPERGSLSPAKTDDVQVRLQACCIALKGLRVDMCSAIPFFLDRHEQCTSNLRDLPLNKRTPAINLLVFLIRMQGTEEKMRIWAEDLLLELQAEEEVDKGGIWMNDPSITRGQHRA